MPIANVSVQIADKIAAGAKQIESRVAGTTTAAKVVEDREGEGQAGRRRAVRTARKA